MTTSLSSPIGTPLLAGALSGFALADVLQLLDLGARSGRLVVDGGPLGRGLISLGRGRISRAELLAPAVPCPGADVATDIAETVAVLLDFTAGRWTFYGDDGESREKAPDDANGSPVGLVLLDAARRRDEREVATAAGADDTLDVPTLAPSDDSAPESGGAVGVCLTAAHLRVLAAVDGVRDVGAIAAATRFDGSRVRESVALLRALALVSPRIGPAGPLEQAA